jgi:hypothetical protein
MRIFKVGDVLEPKNEENRIILNAFGQSPWIVIEGENGIAEDSV